MLVVKKLSFAYGDKKVLHNVDLEVGKAEVVSIVGHNGAGKSTLLKCISGVVRGVEGEMRLLGKPIANVPPYSSIRREMSYTPDLRPIFPRMSVFENLELGGLREKSKAKLAENQERIFSIFPALVELRHRNAGVLSGGERQMLAMGIALMSSPKLILLDEPSSGLAPLVVNQLFEAIEKINRDEGISFLIVEQSVELVEAVTSKIYLLKAGRVMHQGTPKELKEFARQTIS